MGFVADVIDDVVDVVVDVVEDVVGVVVDAVETVVKAVADVVKDVVCEVIRVVKDTVNFIIENPILAIAAIAVGYFVVGPAIAVAWADVSALATGSLGVGLTAWDIAVVGVYSFVETLAASWAAFATAVHFKALMSVHTIATMISADYRALIVGVYKQISVVSEALGYWPAFLNLALMNTRNVVIDVSTALGYSYDIAEITWVTEMNGFLARISALSGRYRNSPERLLVDLQRVVERRYGKIKSEYSRVIFSSLGAVVNTVELVVKDMAKIDTGFRKLISDLPTQLKGQWVADIKGFLKPFDDFQVNVFAPTVKTLNGLLDTLGYEQTKTDNELKGLVSRLRNPGDYIKEIDSFRSSERLRQESLIADIASRPYHRDSEQLRQEYQLTESRLKAIVSILEREIPLPTWHIPEVETPIRPASVAATPRATWFVGDY